MSEEKNSTEVGGIWLSIKDLAERKGVTKQAMSARVKRLEDAGQIEVRQNGRSREVELVAFDRAVGQTGNSIREQSAQTRREDASGVSSALRDAQTDRAVYDARLKQLDYAERSGQLVPLRGPNSIEEALVSASETILRELDTPLKSSLDLFEAAQKGEKELRQVMRRIVTETKKSIASKLLDLALSAESVGPYEISVRTPDED